MAADRRVDGKRCSFEVFVFLTAARADGVDFIANSLKRTLAEQRYLYNNQPPLAAYPDPNAPHIRTGRWDHAMDIDNVRGGCDRLIRWAASKGVRLVKTVSGEPWHAEIQGISSAELIRKFFRADPYSSMPAKQRRLTRELVALRAAARRRGRWTDLEQARAKSIKKYLREVIRGLRDMSSRELDEENRRERLELARDAVAGRRIEL